MTLWSSYSYARSVGLFCILVLALDYFWSPSRQAVCIWQDIHFSEQALLPANKSLIFCALWTALGLNKSHYFVTTERGLSLPRSIKWFYSYFFCAAYVDAKYHKICPFNQVHHAPHSLMDVGMLCHFFRKFLRQPSHLLLTACLRRRCCLSTKLVPCSPRLPRSPASCQGQCLPNSVIWCIYTP